MPNSTSESHFSATSLGEKKTQRTSATEEPIMPPIRTLPRQTGQIEAKPHVDYQNRLWSQIDVLDDVRRMALEQDKYEQFPQGFEDGLQRLREAHISLLQTMNKRREEQNEHSEIFEGGSEREMQLVDEVTRCLRGLRD
ncbi:LADA_0D04544g1_1 [Lachancea dasiensis]|uniref:LADA_0D04544g1_1 n=1 Tax=Lachancea dasiensis TaxID=1072105 RepID=A0A1G4J567_9SACH|nr:LADA_0D04544g1_1 [Lachancea dasiensis]